jgi:hypothetical protein
MASPSDRFRRPTPQITRGGGLSGSGLLIAGVLAVAFGIGIVVGGTMLLGRQSASPNVLDAVAGATGKATPASAPAPAVDDGSWTDDDLKACKAESTAAMETAQRRKLAAVSADRVGLGGPDPELVERATYLLCGASHKPKHLCNDYWRGWFIDALRGYAAEFRQMSQSDYWTKVEVADNARRSAGQGKWTAISDDLDQTTREVAAMHEKIVAAFRGLIADGIIDPHSFGKFLGLGIPPEIGAMIGGATPERNVCG